MKMRFLLNVSLLILFLFILLSCDSGVFAPSASARFIVEISGYELGEDTGVSITLDLEGGESYVSKFASTKNTNRAEILFSELEPGTWRGEVAFVDGTSLIGSYSLSITVGSGAAVTAGLRVDYSSSTGTAAFSHIVSTEGASSITFADVNAAIVEERRMWDDSATGPDVWTQIVAAGDFSTAIRGNAQFPDGLVINLAAAKGPSYHAYGVSDTQAWATRSPYDASVGTYTLNLTDITGAGSGTSYTTDIDLSGVSVPDITSPAEGDIIGGPITVDWTLSSTLGVANIYVFILEEGTVFESATLPNSAITYTSAVTTPGYEYEILVLTVDNQIDPLVIPEIDANAGSYYDVIDRIIRDYTADIDYIGAARVHVTG